MVYELQFLIISLIQQMLIESMKLPSCVLVNSLYRLTLLFCF